MVRRKIEAKTLSYKKWELPKFTTLEFRKKSNKYCVCIPVKDEGEKIKKQLQKMKHFTKIVDIIIADWGSTDGSTNPKFLKSQKVTTLLTKISEGKQAVQLRMAFSYALKNGYKGIIQVDGNGKDGISAIPRFIKALDDGFDYTQGSRFIKGGKAVNTPLSRVLGIRLVATPLVSLAAGRLYTDITNGFRAYSRKLLLHPKVKPFRNVFQSYALNIYLPIRAAQLGLKTQEIPVSRKYPKGKIPSKMTGPKGQLEFLKEIVLATIGHYDTP